jgi:hypothetical protein
MKGGGLTSLATRIVAEGSILAVDHINISCSPPAPPLLSSPIQISLIHTPCTQNTHDKEHEKATVFRRTNASAFTYVDLLLSLSALIVDTASTPQSLTRMAVDTAAGVVDEDPQEAMKAQAVAVHYYPPLPLQTQANGMGYLPSGPATAETLDGDTTSTAMLIAPELGAAENSVLRMPGCPG